MYVNQDGVKNESQKIVCDSCKYNCKYGGSDYCIRFHHLNIRAYKRAIDTDFRQILALLDMEDEDEKNLI